jgi:hypothetical protein
MRLDIDKEKLIKLFKASCADKENIGYRTMCVKHQQSRTRWEIFNDKAGLIRIYQEIYNSKIVLYPLLHLRLTSNTVEYRISLAEYEELKNLFHKLT